MKWLRKAVACCFILVFSVLATGWQAFSATVFDTNFLWLEMTLNYYPVQTNIVVGPNRIGVVSTNIEVTMAFSNSATFTIHPPATNVSGKFDLYCRTNLTDSQDWTWLMRNLPGQTNLLVTNLPSGQAVFRLGTTIIRPGFDQQILDRNDDGSTGLIPMGFVINFYGGTNASLYVNNNGNVTFTSPQPSYTPQTLSSLKTEVIAPFWADVDTRNPDSWVVSFGTNTVNGHLAFGVNWVNVGYYSFHADKLLSCQLVIISRPDTAPGDFDLEFNYDKVQWQWGDVTVGIPPRAGFANNSLSGYELPGSGVDGAFMDTNTVTGLIYNSLNSPVPGRYIFRFRGGQPVP
ncbi:MAG TPA: nidogen-like domain-containing protein [Candidatus Acidoferrum sp.]|nr:nidogen-like domain-containing protein [Candidatus Acidoferrum sp.]